MIVTREAVYFLMQARSYLLQAEQALKVTDDWFKTNRVAGNISQCSEFALKALLYMEGVKLPQSHSHILIIAECGKHKINIPKKIRTHQSTLFEYEKALRYDYNDNVEESEVIAVIDSIKRFFTHVWNSYIPAVACDLRKAGPAMFQTMSDDDVINVAWTSLDFKVDNS